MTETPPLMAFLNARLDDDERVARAVGGEQWHADTHIGDEYNIGVVVGSRGERIASCGVESLDDGDVRAEHIARHDPARELREVEAKRRIMAIHNRRADVFPDTAGGTFENCCDGCGYQGYCDDPVTEDVNGCPILRLLALPFDQHPDFREEWRVDQ